MEICEQTIFTGTTPMAQGYKNIVEDDDYALSSYSLPSSARIFGQSNSANTASLNNGLVMLYGFPHVRGGLPNTTRTIDLANGLDGYPISSVNNGLLSIYNRNGEVKLPQSFPDSLMYIGEWTYCPTIGNTPTVSGRVKLKAPFIDRAAFSDCSGITSFDLDVSDKDNEGSYIKQGALQATFSLGEWSSTHYGEPYVSSLKTVKIKGYENIDTPFGGENSYNIRLDTLEIEGNGNTTAKLGEVAVKNTVVFGDGIKNIEGTFIWGWRQDGTGTTDTYCDSITFGKDITHIDGRRLWTDGVLKYGPYATNKLYITKDNGVFLPSITYNERLTKALGACKKIYVPSVVYQDYLNNETWQPLLTKVEPY